MNGRLLSGWRELALPVRLFCALVVLNDVVSVISDAGSLRRHPAAGAVWVAASLGLLAAVVIWHQTWAWWAATVLPIVYVVGSIATAHVRVAATLIELAFVGLLLTSPMRKHVGGIFGRDRPSVPRRKFVC